MRVRSACDVLRRSAEFDRCYGFGDQVARVSPEDVHSENAIGVLVRQDFHAAVRGTERARATVGHERKYAFLVGHVRRFELVLRFAHRGDFRVRIYDARDRVVVDVAIASHDVLDAGDSLFLRLVREHRAAHDVANGVEAGNVGAKVIVDRDSSARIELDAYGVQAEPSGVRNATDRDQYAIALDVRLPLHAHEHPLAIAASAGDLRSQAKLDALLGEDTLGFFRNVRVHARQDALEVFEDGDFGAQTVPNRPEFEPNVAGSDHY